MPMADLGLYDAESDVPSGTGPIVHKQLGGLRIYSRSKRQLDAGIDRLAAVISETSQKSPGLTPSLLRYVAGERIGTQIPKRVFSAVLGSLLRRGQLDAVICEGPEGTRFRVILERYRLSEFQDRVKETTSLLCAKKTLAIAFLRDRYFPGTAKGRWTHAMFIAARLVRLGIALYVDRYRIELAESVANAIRQSHFTLNALNTERLDAPA